MRESAALSPRLWALAVLFRRLRLQSCQSGEDESIAGTIGGGCVDADVRKAAMEVKRLEKPPMTVFTEPVTPRPLLHIFGAGHVGLGVSRIAQYAGFDTVIADDRAIYANRERFPDARDIHAGEMDSIMRQLNRNELLSS